MKHDDEIVYIKYGAFKQDKNNLTNWIQIFCNYNLSEEFIKEFKNEWIKDEWSWNYIFQLVLCSFS